MEPGLDTAGVGVKWQLRRVALLIMAHSEQRDQKEGDRILQVFGIPIFGIQAIPDYRDEDGVVTQILISLRDLDLTAIVQRQYLSSSVALGISRWRRN